MPESEGGEALAHPALVDLGLAGVHARGRDDRAVGVVVTGHGRAEDRHHRVADELHHGTPFPNNGVDSSRRGGC